MDILLAEDDLALRELIQRMLTRAGHRVQLAADGQEAWEAFQRHPVRFLLTDWMMPRVDGVELIRQLRALPMEEPLYILMLTAKGQPRDIVEAIDAGADDYLVKPVDEPELMARVAVGQRVLHAKDEMRQLRYQLDMFATHDEVTGLLNRKAIIDRGSAEINRSRRERVPISVLMLGVNTVAELRAQNDIINVHQALRLVGNVISDAVRSYDHVGRWERGRFLLVLPHTTLAQAMRTAERLVAQVREMGLVQANGAWLPLDINIGIAEANSPQQLVLEQLIARADKARVTSRQAGKAIAAATDS